MSCVNTSSKEFKYLLNKVDISSPMLELIIHKRQNAENNDRFPTVEEVNNLLKPKPFEGNKDIIELWRKQYSSPINCLTLEMANVEATNAKKFFGDNSVSIIEKKNNTYDVVVGRPANYNIDYYRDNELDISYDGESESSLRNTIDNRIDAVKRKVRALNNVLGLMEIAKRDFEFLPLKRKVGALRKKVAAFNREYNTNVRVDNYGNIIHNLSRLENLLSKLENPNLIEDLVKGWHTEQATARQEEINKDLKLLEREDYYSSEKAKQESENALEILKQEGVTLDNSLIDDLLSKAKPDNPYHQLFKQIVGILRNNGIPINIVIDSSLPSIAARKQDGFKTATIRFNPSLLLEYLMTDDRNNIKGNLMKVLTHELVHSVTAEILNYHPSWSKIKGFNEAQTEFATNTWNLYLQCKEQLKGTEWYGLTNAKEFIAEALTNREFQIVLSKIKIDKKENAFKRFINYITNLFNKVFKAQGIELKNSALEEIMSISQEYFNAANKDLRGGIDDYTGSSDYFDNDKLSTEDSYITKQQKIIKQIDNLLNDNLLSATEVRHIAEQAVYWISDHITELQENPELAKTIYGDKFERKNFSAMSRADVVRTIGVDNIMEMCKQKFSPENNDFDSFDTIDKATAITDNWEAIMAIAQNTFLNTENFSIVSSNDGKVNEVNEDIFADADNFNESNDSDSVEEAEGNLQEHWQIESRCLDVLGSMSQLVKKALLQCYQLDNNGNPIVSEFGIKERVNVRQATNTILRLTQGALTLEDMVAKLQEQQNKNPWLKQVIERLIDTTGKESDFQSQFFSTFCKHFQPYSVVIKENGKYKSIIVNNNPALTEAITQITTQYKVGEHPLFTSEGINRHNYKELKEAFESLEKFKHSGYDINNEANKNEVANTLGYISNILGYYVTPDMVKQNLNNENYRKMYSALYYIVDALGKNLDNKTYTPFTFKSEGSIVGNVREFLKPITEGLEDTMVSAFYDSGKMYQSYITPSYMTKLITKFKQKGESFDNFIMSEYGNSEWFHNGTDIERGWRNAWLKALVTDRKSREIFSHKVQLNFDKHNYMKNMDNLQYTLSLITEYFSEATNDTQSKVPAWFRVPMLSNKPSSEFIRFYSERGVNYKDTLTNGFMDIFNQELSRIQTVMMRNLDSKDPRFIKNFDKNGKKFCFLDFMNDYLIGKKKDSELGKLLKDKIDGKEIDEAQLYKLAYDAIYDTMETRAKAIVEQWNDNGIVKAAKKITGIGSSKAEIMHNLENFVWNDTFAAMNIMELTITDIAYYKDAEDLQKRLAQLHSPGIRANINVLDYKGQRVTDGKTRTLYLKDFDNFISNIIDNISVVFDKKIAEAPRGQKTALKALKESLVGKDGAYRKINVADAQGYASPTSYRKKALMFGKWSTKAEEIYQKLRKGDYNYSDLNIAFQPLKPFVYSQHEMSSGVSEAPITNLKVPVQNKNSEYLLIMADAILQGENTGRPNLLRAIYEVMENSHYDADGNYKTDGIDTVQFESTVKSGLHGAIDINKYINDANGEAKAKAVLEACIYKTEPITTQRLNSVTGEVETIAIESKSTEYNPDYVDTLDLEDYTLQQEVPEHFKNHEQMHGSQLRYIIVSELADKDAYGNEVTYNVEGRKLSAEEFKKEYEDTIAANIEESLKELSEELHLNDYNAKERNIALSKLLQREILSSSRYSIDLLQACSVDENGKFRIPLGDPIQSKRVEQLINSIIKNRVNKQEIKGGPVVQVTNFGTSRELNIRFKDKNGGLLKTREEWQSSKKTTTPIEPIYTTIAPYYNTKITESNKEEITNKIQKIFLDKAQEVANNLGISIASFSKNIGGFQFQEGETVGTQVRELSYTFELNTTDKSKADLFASIMGDLGYEQQEAVISYNSANSEEAADALALKIKVKNADNVPDILEKSGFMDYTFNETTNEITLLAFSKNADEFGDNIELLIQNLKDNYVGTEKEYIQSRYLDKEARRETYETWSKERKLSKGKDRDSSDKKALGFYAKKVLNTEGKNRETEYLEYVKENQGGIAYYEVFAPIYTNELFNQFADKEGNINIEAIEALDPDLLKMVGYRIPTESKYSIAPMKIVGFLPREAGDGIMMPYDITLINGSDYDIDKAYLMLKDLNIKRTKTSKSELHKILYDSLVESQSGKLSFELKQQLGDLVSMFLDNPFSKNALVNQRTAEGVMSLPEGAYNKMLRLYLQNAYTIEKPTEGRIYRNNKIVDMTYEVLTQESSAAEMLNPGGFEPQKRMGYLITATKNTDMSYEQLSKMKTEDLKNLAVKGKNLMFIDTHVQFYKQNNAAGALIGIFAVNRVAHAVIENEGYKVNVFNACGVGEPFTIGNMTFTHKMTIDPRNNIKGESLGKVLGCLVASSVDAVKDPVLNLMNINSNTANVLITLIRLGMPFEDASLFLSQNIITEVLNEYNKANITGNTPLYKIVERLKNKIIKDAHITKESALNKEALTKKELIQGLKEGTQEINYKVLIALQNLLKLSQSLQLPTFATRYNSITSAVGPLIIDNLIAKYKALKLVLESNILDARETPIGLIKLLEKHPILKQFSKSYDIANELFKGMPANSIGFREILNYIFENNSYLLGDRKILSDLSDFYQSYLLTANGTINKDELYYYITKFPKEFYNKKYKAQYSDNALIQAIKYDTDKAGRMVLKIDTTGLDSTYKETLSSAWIDLHRKNPELSEKLFKYCFFRGGIGFNPKTFISLTPVYVKERIKGYVDTYRLLPKVVPEVVYDQFVRNNWDNNKLVPIKEGIRWVEQGDNIIITDQDSLDIVGNAQYFKIKTEDSYKIYKLTYKAEGTRAYKEVKPLGSNKDYVEITDVSKNPIENFDSLMDDTIDYGEIFPTTTDTQDAEITQSKQEQVDLLHRIFMTDGKTFEEAEATIQEAKSLPAEQKESMETRIKDFLRRRLTELKVPYNEESLNKEFEKLC